jgi:hypothetical protein
MYDSDHDNKKIKLEPPFSETGTHAVLNRDTIAVMKGERIVSVMRYDRYRASVKAGRFLTLEEYHTLITKDPPAENCIAETILNVTIMLAAFFIVVLIVLAIHG